MRFPDPTRWGIEPQNLVPLRWVAATWTGAALGLALGTWLPALLPAVVALLVAGRSRNVAVVSALLAAGIVSGAGATARTEAMMAVDLPPGDVVVTAVAVTDPQRGHRGDVVMVSTRQDQGSGFGRGIVLLVEADGLPILAAGDTIAVSGTLRDRPGRFGRHHYRARISSADVDVISSASGPFFAAGNRLRRHVQNGLGEHYQTDRGGLLAGFLVGDTTQVPDDRLEHLRRTGLTHYVAVSGSNVALFLAAWWLLMGPLQLPMRWRAATGLFALGVFVVATRWEASVVRASAMAAVVLGGRLVGLPVDTWRALGVAVCTLLLVSGDLAFDVGFQLSVAATIGVLVGVRLVPDRRPRWLWTGLVVAGAAQLAVLPILLWHFGTIPLFSPVANLVAAPLVTSATVTGGLGAVFGISPLRQLGLWLAGVVWAVAEYFSGWPQLEVGGALLALAALLAFTRRGLRPAVVMGSVVLAAVASLPHPMPSTPTVTFLDVGQGDAIVIRDPSGATALIDGGRDPVVLERALRRAAVRRLDLLVVTHGDADHAGGLQELLDEIPVGELWYPAHQPAADLTAALLDQAATAGVPTRPVSTGYQARLGSLDLQVLGPSRRYASDNDGSIVIWVDSGFGTALLTGDAEKVAQGDMVSRSPDILQVPHHGSTTTDVGWLSDTVGEVAVISVGVNPYGHPAAEILDTLHESGAITYTTLDHGDVTISLCRDPC